MNSHILKKALLPKHSPEIKVTYWAEGLANYFPELTYKEVKSYLEDFEDNYEGEDLDLHQQFYSKYPFIEKDTHIFFSTWLIMFKMNVIEGWENVSDRKLFYEELSKRINLVFKLQSSTNTP